MSKMTQPIPTDLGHLIGSILVAVLAEGNRMLFPDGQVNADRSLSNVVAVDINLGPFGI